MQSAKDATANISASAKAGMDKTKAVVEEKAEKLTTRDPVKKEMAGQKKEAKMHEAERMKHEVREQNAAAKRGDYGHHDHGHTAGYTTTGTTTARGPAGYNP